MRTRTPWGGWEPLTPAEVAGLLHGTTRPWWIAGGYAIEFAVGRELRPHTDVDVFLLRAHQAEVQRLLPGWEWWAADPPGTLRPWRPGEVLPPAVHDIWCRPSATDPWRLQVMLDESDGTDWVSRRDPRVRRPITTLGHPGSGGIPYLATEIQLYYKARQRRDKDELDFAAALPTLSDTQRRWLADTIILTHGAHPWLPALTT